jgi:UDP-glucose 4-epimerase
MTTSSSPDAPTDKKRMFIAGGCGFIGAHAVRFWLGKGWEVVAYDNLSTGILESVAEHRGRADFRFIKGDLLDAALLEKSMAGVTRVLHLAGNTNIAIGIEDPRRDLRGSIETTQNLLEAMLRTGVNEIMFASTGAVYGSELRTPVAENDGPLIPFSLYGAGKIAAEALIGGFSHLFGLKSTLFRFANVVGGGMRQGVIHDFIRKLRQRPGTLEVLGDGSQVRNFMLVDDCLEGMEYLHAQHSRQCEIYNLGGQGVTTITEVAGLVAEALGIGDLVCTFTGGPSGWPGDIPNTEMAVGKARAAGWLARYSSCQAVSIAARLIAREMQIDPNQESFRP